MSPRNTQSVTRSCWQVCIPSPGQWKNMQSQQREKMCLLFATDTDTVEMSLNAWLAVVAWVLATMLVAKMITRETPLVVLYNSLISLVICDSKVYACTMYIYIYIYIYHMYCHFNGLDEDCIIPQNYTLLVLRFLECYHRTLHNWHIIRSQYLTVPLW